jgi:hypothetical protein
VIESQNLPRRHRDTEKIGRKIKSTAEAQRREEEIKIASSAEIAKESKLKTTGAPSILAMFGNFGIDGN